MKIFPTLAFLVCAATSLAGDWRVALPGWAYQFPRDHGPHREFKTEWWYFTGNLRGASGEIFGYELTFFRHGIRPPGDAAPLSRFVIGDLKFAHFAITDVTGRRFRFAQKTSRGAFGEAGFDDGDRLAWIDDWSLRMSADGDRFELHAETAEIAADLLLVATKPPAIHGASGVSEKAAGEGHASHYYSDTRLTTTGDLRLEKKRATVSGESWFDHEWATNQLAPGQAGWNWLSVQFEDGTELMLYDLRLKNGEIDPSSSGTFVAADGTTAHLARGAFTMQPTGFWQSPKSGAKYPTQWQVEVPERRLRFSVKAAVEDQELALGPLTYWEGAVAIEGTSGEQPLRGRGYLELTGYAGPLDVLSR